MLRAVTVSPRFIVALAVLAAGCQEDVASMDGVFYSGDDRLVHCAVNLDTKSRVSEDSITGGLDRAKDRHEIVEFYTHHPGHGGTVPIDKIEYVLAGAQARGLAFNTYSDFAQHTDVSPGIALSFDDTSVEAWVEILPLLAKYNAHVTFFISQYYSFNDQAREGLHQLADAGHAIEAHTVRHLHAPDYVEQFGLDAYLHDEVDPSIKVLRDEGFPVDAFAYPFGARTSETDQAIAKRVPVIRSVAFSYPEVESPCPH
jgi:peptidoglycan/xylan/chitin deacetylase (PgdA/CDA1 family)